MPENASDKALARQPALPYCYLVYYNAFDDPDTDRKNAGMVIPPNGWSLISSGPDQGSGFLHILLQLIEKNLADPEFTVSRFCKAMLLSQPQLYRKVFEHTGKSPSQLIRTVRMLRAVQFLETTDLSIMEVAWKVGFNDPNYFARIFRKEFGHARSIWLRPAN